MSISEKFFLLSSRFSVSQGISMDIFQVVSAFYLDKKDKNFVALFAYLVFLAIHFFRYCYDKEKIFVLLFQFKTP